MNKKGQTMGITLISLIFFLVAGFLMLNFLPNEITNFRSSIGCADSSTLSYGGKLLCLCSDSIVPYFIFLIIGVVITSLTARLYL